jgi:hypothetical protein
MDEPVSYASLILYVTYLLTYLLTYSLTHSLTPWCRILFEKLIVIQLVKKYPAFLWNPNVHYRVHTSPPLDPVLSQLNPVHPIDPYLPKVHLNVIFPPTPRSSHYCLGRAKESVHVRGALKHLVTIKNVYGEGFQPHAQPPSWRATPCRLYATAYSMYSQLPSVPGGLPSVRNLRTPHAVVTRDPPNMVNSLRKGKGKVVHVL